MAWRSPCSGSRCSTHGTRRAESPAAGARAVAPGASRGWWLPRHGDGWSRTSAADLARNGKGARDRFARVTFVASPAGADMEPVATDDVIRSDPGEEEAERIVRFSKGGKQMDAERRRLEETRTKAAPWQKWGPYLSERQWGTVREDYSDSGNAWDYFSHDQARSRAYRWGEDGLAGISDDRQLLCFALTLWNGKDAILKERLFGLTNSEGNHGEDVKEYYFYLDSTPTHSYMKYLYKYPQAAYPYSDLVATNRGRSRQELEYELISTGVFDDDRYFDVFVEYAKEAAEDILIQV